MSYQYYILLYTAIYDYCTVPSRGGISFNQKGGASLQGADLYKKLNQFLTEHCKQMRDVSRLLIYRGVMDSRLTHRRRRARSSTTSSCSSTTPGSGTVTPLVLATSTSCSTT